MTNNPPLPSNRSGVEPAAVDPVDEMLSALVDAELPASELAELEDFAVNNDQTLDRLTGPFHSTRTDLLGLLDEPAPVTAKAQHLAAALDAMDEPEVISLAAARASQDRANQKLKRSQQLNRRLRQMSAVAAGFVVVAGIGVVALQGGLTGSDASDETAGGFDSTETTAAASSAIEAESFNQADAAGVAEASDDGAMEESDDAMEEDTMEEGEATDLADDTLAVSPEASSAPVLRLNTPVQEITVDQLSEESGLDRNEIVQRSAEAEPVVTQCLDQAVANGVAADQIQQTFIVEQDGLQYELIVLASEELRVFELPDCTQVD